MDKRHWLAGWLPRMREALTGRSGTPESEKDYKEQFKNALGGGEDSGAAAPAAKPLQKGTDAPAPKAGPSLNWKKPGGEKPAAAPAKAKAEAPEPAASTVRRPPRTKPTPFMRQKIRDRYLAARFPGAKRTDADLANTDDVIKAARLYFEDGDGDRACEWLAFASDANPDEGLWLAQLEILFLKRNGEDYTELAGLFRERFPESTHWDDVTRLGARITKGEPLFAGAQQHAVAGDEHYGLWPQMQNWIQAPFDLTGDVLSAEFHAKMKGGTAAPPITAKAS
jgi:hypothetical protein